MFNLARPAILSNSQVSPYVPAFSFYNEDNSPGALTVNLPNYPFDVGLNVVGLMSGTKVVTGVSLDGNSCSVLATLAVETNTYLEFWGVTVGAAGTGTVSIGHTGGVPFRTAAGLWMCGDASFVAGSAVSDTDDSQIIDLSDSANANDIAIGIGLLRDNSYSPATDVVGYDSQVAGAPDFDEETDTTRWWFGAMKKACAAGANTLQINTNESAPEFACQGLGILIRPN